MYFEFLGEISYALIIYIISKGSSESDSIQPSPSRRKEVVFLFLFPDVLIVSNGFYFCFIPFLTLRMHKLRIISYFIEIFMFS